MSRRQCRGFTLVELLVVITIIGMLMGLLVPAVTGVRETMRSAQCASNQRNVALGLIRYEGTNHHFPGFTNRVGPDSGPLLLSTGNTERCIEGSWVVMILADLDRPDLWEVWNKGTSYVPASGKTADDDRNRFMRVLTCPSNPPERQGANDTPLAYVVNSGTPDPEPTQNAAAEVWGIFHDRGFESNSKRRVEKGKVSIDYIRANDGVGQTLLLSENVNAGSWAQANNLYWLTDRQGEGLLGFNWHWDDKKNPVVNHINLDIRRNDKTLASAIHSRPSSWHHGGVNVVFCDGRGHFLNEDIDPVIYWHLMTPNDRAARVGGTAISAGIPGTLSETSF